MTSLEEMSYQAKNFENLLGMSGFSDQLLTNHFTLYQGYVANTNKLLATLNELLNTDKNTTPEYAELKRRFGWEWNGMRLHEYYFANMSKNSPAFDQGSDLFKKIATDFGSYDHWIKDFKSVGAMRGIGWVILAYDPSVKKLFNVWVNEHDAGHLAGAVLLLIMDVFEHAYLSDYGIKRADYIESFFKIINWDIVSTRFMEASK